VSEARKRGVFLRDVSSMGCELGLRTLRLSVKDEEAKTQASELELLSCHAFEGH